MAFEKLPLAFNPLRFLANGLIEKNQQRKELERQINMKELAEQNAAKEKAAKLELEIQSMKIRPQKSLHEIAEIEDEDAILGARSPINVDIKIGLKAMQKPTPGRKIAVDKLLPERRLTNLKVSSPKKQQDNSSTKQREQK